MSEQIGSPGYNAVIQRIKGALAFGQKPKDLNQEDFKFYRNHLLMLHEQAKTALDVAKANEMELRNALVAFVSDPEKMKGTENIPLENGYKLKVEKSLNYGWIKAADGKQIDKNKIEDALEKIEADGPVGELIAERLVKWAPTLSLTEYKELNAKHKAIIDAVIVTTPGAPKVEIVPPKGTKQV